MSSIRNLSDLFLAYQMPECQVTHVFSTSGLCTTLTTSFLAYQMPSRASHRPENQVAASADPRLRSPGMPIGGLLKLRPLKAAGVADEIETHVKEEADVEFQRCGPQNTRSGQGG